MKVPSIQRLINQWKAGSNFLALTNTSTDALIRQLTLAERVVRITTVSGKGTITATLPSVSEAAGLIFSIALITLGGTVYAYIQDQNDSYEWTDLTLDTVKDRATLYSDGYEWVQIKNTIA